MTFLNVPFKIGILSLPPSLKIMIKTCSMLSVESPYNYGDDNPQDHCDRRDQFDHLDNLEHFDHFDHFNHFYHRDHQT